jgi:hypothetical protein
VLEEQILKDNDIIGSVERLVAVIRAEASPLITSRLRVFHQKTIQKITQVEDSVWDPTGESAALKPYGEIAVACLIWLQRQRLILAPSTVNLTESSDATDFALETQSSGFFVSREYDLICIPVDVEFGELSIVMIEPKSAHLPLTESSFDLAKKVISRANTTGMRTFGDKLVRSRVRTTHQQNMTVAVRAITSRNASGQRS